MPHVHLEIAYTFCEEYVMTASVIVYILSTVYVIIYCTGGDL